MSFESNLWVVLTVQQNFGNLLALKIYEEVFGGRIFNIESYFRRSCVSILKFFVQLHFHSIVYLVNNSVPQRGFFLMKREVFLLKIRIHQ